MVDALLMLVANMTLTASAASLADTNNSAPTTLSLRRRKAFSSIYSEALWMKGGDGAKCLSGWSHVESGQALHAIAAVTSVMNDLKIGSLLDLPFGDLCFSSAILSRLRQNGSSFEYIGVDIVPDLVRSARETLGDAVTKFVQADVALLDTLPHTELVFSRQMMQHMCSADTSHTLRLISTSGARYALMTTWSTSSAFQNDDIPCASGGYRAQDLTKPPFSLPPPLRFFPEHYPSDSRVGLGLWRVPFL